MTEQGHDEVVERFEPTNGRTSGYLGLALALVVLGIAVWDWDTGTPLGVAIVAVLGGLLAWVALLRPALWVTRTDLVMRGMFRTDRIPLAAIDKVTVAQVLAVFVGERRFVTPVIGQTARQALKTRAGRGRDAERPGVVHDYGSFAEGRIVQLAGEAREQAGIGKRSPEQQALADDVRRSYAWPEIVGVAVLVLAFVVWLLA